MFLSKLDTAAHFLKTWCTYIKPWKRKIIKIIVLIMFKNYRASQISGWNWDMNSRKLIKKQPLYWGKLWKELCIKKTKLLPNSNPGDCHLNCLCNGKYIKEAKKKFSMDPTVSWQHGRLLLIKSYRSY